MFWQNRMVMRKEKKNFQKETVKDRCSRQGEITIRVCWLKEKFHQTDKI